jgi:hypothetical protein
LSISKFYTCTFTPYTLAAATTFPYDMVETAGSTFKGALDSIGSAEKWADAATVAISTHWIACSTGVTVTQGQKLTYGSRTFNVTGIPDPSTLKPGHHQEIYVKEIT